MLNEKKELKNNELNNKELPEGVTELSMEDLEQVTGGARPLYIVDGVSMADGLSGINPADIEGMAVLKDASATALYGSKAGN